MREHLGEEYSGMVSAVTSFGLFVTLDQLYVEGLIHITELGGDYFRFDEMRQELRGERTGIRYTIGTRLQIQVSRVDLDARKIDFRLVREGEDAARAPASNGRAAKVASSPSSRQREGRDEAYDAQRASLKRKAKGAAHAAGKPRGNDRGAGASKQPGQKTPRKRR
jgi:ribonuclease R